MSRHSCEHRARTGNPMRIRLFSALLTLAALAGGVCAAPISTEISRAHKVVEDLIAGKRIPGFSIAVARSGRIVWSEGFGLANVEQGVADYAARAGRTSLRYSSLQRAGFRGHAEGRAAL